MKITNRFSFPEEACTRLSFTFTRVIDPRQALLLMTKVKYACPNKQQQCGGKTLIYYIWRAVWKNIIQYRCSPQVPYESVCSILHLWVLAGPFSPFLSLKATVVCELCQAKPTYSCHGGLQGRVVRGMGANLLAWNTFKALPWPDSAKSPKQVA